jgi:hypothetical protein
MTGRRIVRTLGRVGVGLVAVALLLGTIDVTVWLRTKEFNVDEQNRPFTVSVGMGQPARARTFVATALSVRGAAVIHDRADHTTPGVWLIVRVQAAAVGESMTIGYAGLRDARGRVFRSSNRLDGQFAGTLFSNHFSPGVPDVGEIAFELPRDAATSATLLLAEERGFDLRMDSMVEIKLDPISPATVDQWAADTTPTTLMAVTVGQ